MDQPLDQLALTCLWRTSRPGLADASVPTRPHVLELLVSGDSSGQLFAASRAQGAVTDLRPVRVMPLGSSSVPPRAAGVYSRTLPHPPHSPHSDSKQICASFSYRSRAEAAVRAAAGGAARARCCGVLSNGEQLPQLASPCPLSLAKQSFPLRLTKFNRAEQSPKC